MMNSYICYQQVKSVLIVYIHILHNKKQFKIEIAIMKFKDHKDLLDKETVYMNHKDQ
jgi:hypothetical protein